MISLNKHVKTFLLVGSFFLLSAAAVLFAPNGVSAYTCDYSNNGGSTYVSNNPPGFSAPLKEKGGSCVITKPDTANGGVAPNSKGKCPDDKPIAWQGSCYQGRTEYTDLKPTKDDGSAVDEKDWISACSRADLDYNSDRHRCEDDIRRCSWVASDRDSIDADCQAIGNGDVPALNSVNPDDTTAKVQECKKAKANFNTKTHECDWNEQTCPAKNGGQGKWIDGQCKAYSDYTTKETCEDPKVGGQFKQDPSDASHWECVKPGTDVKPQNPEDAPAEGVDGNADTTVKDKCGNARTNLIACDGTGAVALNGVLKIVISVLTVLVGIAAVGGLAWASILYAKATDNQSNVSEARTLIQEIVIGLVLYVLLLAIVNFLVPGGLF